MIQLASKDLSLAAVNRLNTLQTSVNNQADFTQKTVRAQQLWKAKNNSKIGKKTFNEIKDTLTAMCVSIEICNYCELNEANDIEHIAPKSFFPELAFVWENYLLACKQCNTGYKLAKCYVLDHAGAICDVEQGIEPIYKTLALINPRLEDPNRFMLLNLQTFKYKLLRNISEAERNKAMKTIEILGLNTRPQLIKGRERAAVYYYARMERLVKVLNAPNLVALKAALSPYDLIDESQDLDSIKAFLKESFKASIVTYKHPSVWHSIKIIASKTDRKWQHLFTQLPEALRW